MNRYMIGICTLLIAFVLLTGSNATKVSLPPDGQVISQNTTLKLNDVLKFKNTDDCKIVSLDYDKKYFKLKGNINNEFTLTAIKKGNTIITFRLNPSSGEDITLINYIKIG